MTTGRLWFVAILVVGAGMAGCVSQDADEDAASEVSGTINPDAPRSHGKQPTPPGKYDFSGPYGRVLREGSLDILAPERVYVPSELDGADIEMGIWRPDTDQPVPVIVHASPYYGFLMTQRATVTDTDGYYGSLIENFVPHGYAVVGLSLRGTGDSGGCNDLMGPKETADMDQAITWLGQQEWTNGRIAMTGLSYDGSTPWGVAATGNAYLKTIIPMSGVPDLYGMMYRNGSAETRGPAVLNALYYVGDAATAGAQPQRPIERLLCPDALQGIGWSVASGATGATDPLGFWDQRNRKPGVAANYNGSIFSIQGLQDWNVDPSQVIPWVDELEAGGRHVKQLLGQWRHDFPDRQGTDSKWQWHRADFKQILLTWLDQELKGLARDTGPAVQVQDDLGRWRNEDHYPPHDTTWTKYHLTPDERLEQGGAGSGSILLRPVLVPDLVGPAAIPAETMREAVDFVTAPVEQETLVVGLPKVHVTVTPHAPGGYLAAYLYDRTPGGEDRRIGWTTMNLAFADGSTERTEVVPGVPLLAKMEIQPMDSVIPEGHQLVLRLWVFTDGDRLPTIPPGTVSLELGDDVSVLKLPTVERGPDVYFKPPRP